MPEVPLDKIDTPADYRQVRPQVTAAHVAMLAAKVAGRPFKSPGEYLGDVQAHDLFRLLSNVNQNHNTMWSIGGTYLVFADYDFEGDGHFIGLRLELKLG